MPSGLSRDVIHSEAYFSQFLKRMEFDVVTLSEKFWPYFFFLWLAYALILIIIRIMLQFGETMPNFFRYFGLFNVISTKAEMNSILIKEQLGNQVIFGFLIIEFLVIHYYFSLPNNIEVMPEHKITSMVKMMDAKIKLYLSDEQNTGILMLRKKLENDLREFEGETEEDKEEMSKYIRTKPRECDEKTFRGIKFQGEPARKTTMISFQAYEDINRRTDMDESSPMLGNLADIAEFRNRQETAFKIDENTVLNNLNLEEMAQAQAVQVEDDNKYTTEIPVLQLVSSLIKNFAEEEIEAPRYQEQPLEDLLGQEEEKKQVHIMIYLDQLTTTQIKVLYKERNTHIYNIARMLNSLAYVTGRLMILPLLYSLTEKTPTNLLFLFVTAAYVFKFNIGSFEDQMKIYMPIFTLVIFIENLYQFFSELPTTKEFMSFNNKMQESNTAQSSFIVHSSFYRLWLIAIASVGFSSIIWTAKFVFTYMFVIRQKASDIFYTYCIDDRKIEVDFYKWKHYKMMVNTLLVNWVYAHLNDVYITCLIVYLLVNSSRTLLLVLMIGMFVLNILMRLTKSYTTLAMEESAVNKLKLGLRVVVIVLFSMEFILQIFDILQIFNLYIPNSSVLAIFKGELVGSHLMIIVTLLFYDLLRAHNYVMEKRRIIRYHELHTKYSDICEAQETNESKIYERVLIMMANDKLQSQIDRYLKKGIINSAADLNYYKTDIKQKLRANRYSYLERYLDSWSILRIKATEAFYVSLLKVCNQYVQQDMLYLFSKVCQIDQGIVDPSNFNLTDYLSCDYQMLDDIYTAIVSFYTSLLMKEENTYKLYKSKMNHFEQHSDVNIEEDYRMCGMQAEQQQFSGESGISAFRKPYGASKPSRKRKLTIYGANSSKQVIELSLLVPGLLNIEGMRPHEETGAPELSFSSLSRNLKKERLSAAADILAKYLLTKKSYQSGGQFFDARNGAKFKIEEEECFVIFHNIKSDNMRTTQGLTKLQFWDILQLLSCLFWSNLETIVSLNIIIVLYFNGGIMSILILGILFFRILIEEQGGRLVWWEVMNIIFFIQFVFKIMANSLIHNNYSGEMKYYGPWVIILGGRATQGTLRADATVQIFIMWLIHFINKKIINLKEGKNVIATGVSIARVNLFY